MIKRITNLQEMKRVIDVGDKIELNDHGSNYYNKNEGIIVKDPKDINKYNVLFKDGYYGDDEGIYSLDELLESYCEVWDEVVLIKEVEDKNIDPYVDFENSIGSRFKIYVEPCGLDCYCGEVTLLNFHPSQSIFLDKNEKLLIVEPKDIKYMRALKEIKSE